LHLEVVSSATLQKGENITIDPLGLAGRYRSLRAQNDEEQNAEVRLAPDSFTYFGSMPDLEYEDEFDANQTTTMIVNDFVIPPRNRENAEQHRGRHFQIWFDCGISSSYEPQRALSANSGPGYYIRDLGIGFGVFKKIDVASNQLVFQQAGIPALGGPGGAQGDVQSPVFPTGCIALKDNMLINIGEAYIVVNLLPEGVDDEGPHHTLRLKIFGGSNNGEVYEFSVAEMNKGHREVVMGRTPDCDIRINDKLLSKA
jgi:hypothetical protein